MCDKSDSSFCENNDNNNEPQLPAKVAVKCDRCQKEVLINRRRYLHSKRKIFFCCKEHKDLSQRKVGGNPLIIPAHYYNISINNYRKRAFIHYGKKCQSCGYGDEEKMLDVHHKDNNHKNNNIENLEVLCVWCHAIICRNVDKHDWDGNIHD